MLKFEGELPYGGSIADEAADEVRRQLGYESDAEQLLTAEDADQPGAEVWHLAPEDSHVAAFRYLDADPPEIHVKFKPKGNQGESYYIYYPASQEYARTVWEEMAPVDHPGIVIWHWLIRGGVPYKKM